MPNRLARESSPYLRQHEDNPVDWYAWGEEAFARARAEDKPVFLSIGYSTCHWCHVMAHESFENDEVARVLNEHFVSIKVDREERPDIDRVYMLFVQATAGSGGWPMSVWLTPDRQPFFGGTYFPPTSRWGRPGFIDILNEIARLWRADRARLTAAAGEVTAQLIEAARRSAAGRPAAAVPGPELLARGAEEYARSFDRRHGGFGEAPKFPRPSELLFLLRQHAREPGESRLEMVTTTLRAMALGGMRDHIGGGFHRYSVDAEWRVPHFEKMLSDQAQLAIAYLEASQATGDGFYASVAADTLAYVQREMTHPDGGFYSAEDADSVPPESAGDPHAHKTEGAFYLWTADEIDRLLGDDAPVFKARYGIEPNGNAPSDPQGEFTGKNLLYTARTIEEVAQVTGRTVDAVIDALGRARQVLYEARQKRPRPHLDDKVLTAWNGLMIAAFARAARVLNAFEGTDAACRESLEAAVRAARFIESRLWDATSRTLFRRFRDGDVGIAGYSEDYAYLVWGLLELFQASGDAHWLEWAIELQRRLDALFWDEANGGWFNTTGEDPSVLLRLKETYDGAEPAASSVGTFTSIVIGHLTGDADALKRAERTLALASGGGDWARAAPFLLSALAWWHAGGQQVVIVGPPDREDTWALWRTVASRYVPFAVLVPVVPGDGQAALSRRLPWIASMEERDGRATAYVCRGFACDQPVTDADALASLLGPR